MWHEEGDCQQQHEEARLGAAIRMLVASTHRLLSSSFLGLPYRILSINHKKELLRSYGYRCNVDSSGNHAPC